MSLFQRTIYTQAAVSISGVSGASQFDSGIWTRPMFFSGVQSCSYTVNTPRENVAAFGTLGNINRVQVAPTTATLEMSLVVNSGNTGIQWLSGLVADSWLPNPTGVTVTASGIGEIQNAILTSARLEASVGALATLGLTFDGITGVPQTSYVQPVTTVNTLTVPVVTPDAFGTIYFDSSITSATGCPQSIRVTYEMPVERINCLGNDINKPAIFTRPPGTLTYVVEGVDIALVGHYATGVRVGPYKITAGNAKLDSAASNLAVGDAAETFTMTSSTIGFDAVVSG